MVYTLCTLGCAHTVTFEGPTEAESLILIFPLSDSSQGRLWPADGSVNEGRLGPPESAKRARTGSWELWLRKDLLLRSERKRRLLHNFPCQKMISECTIFLI